jgi:nitric oxide reductase activation protein
LKGRKEDQKIAIIFTDGEPAYSRTRLRAPVWIDLMRLQLQALSRSGVEVLMICLDSSGQPASPLQELIMTELPEKNLLRLTDLKELPKGLTQWLTLNLKRGRS